MFLATKTLYLSLVRFGPSFVAVVYCSLSVLFESVNKSFLRFWYLLTAIQWCLF